MKIQFQNGAHLKRGYFWPTFHFFSYQGKITKIPSAYISLTYIHVFCSTYWLFFFFFFALPILKKKNMNLSSMVSLWCDSWCWFLFAPFWNNQQITKFKYWCMLWFIQSVIKVWNYKSNTGLTFCCGKFWSNLIGLLQATAESPMLNWYWLVDDVIIGGWRHSVIGSKC